MNRSGLTTRRENLIRWGISSLLPVLLTVPVLFLIKVNLPEKEYETAPPILLDYVVIPPKEEPKEEPKPIVQRQTKPVEQKVTPRKQITVPVKETLSSQESADITAGSKEPTPQEKIVEKKAVGPMRISSEKELDNTSFEPLFNPKPSYPVVARRNGIQGYVDLELTIDEKGRIVDHRIINSLGHPAFGTETAKVISRWRFPPPRKKGKRVEVVYLYRINFTLN